MKSCDFPVPIYCINLTSSTDRKKRMIDRFNEKGITENVKFIEAIPYNSFLVEYYKGNSNGSYDKFGSEFNILQHSKDIACYASHIKAIRTFLEESKNEYGLICEDDILFHNDFINEFLEIYSQRINLISLTYMITGKIDNTLVGNNLIKIDSDKTWGAQAYLISKDYAIKVLELYDHPFDVIMEIYNMDKISSEIIIRNSDGFMTAVPLVIEDCISSDRAEQDIPYHIKHFCYWDYLNYNLCDNDKLSPLSNVKPSDAWEHYFY